MQKDHDRVKLHVTVMNTLMRKDPSGTSIPMPEAAGRSGMKQRESFDASQILKVGKTIIKPALKIWYII